MSDCRPTAGDSLAVPPPVDSPFLAEISFKDIVGVFRVRVQIRLRSPKACARLWPCVGGLFKLKNLFVRENNRLEADIGENTTRWAWCEAIAVAEAPAIVPTPTRTVRRLEIFPFCYFVRPPLLLSVFRR